MRKIIIKDFNHKIDGKELFKELSYEFTNDKKYLLSGKNGCGKTTLVRNICKITRNKAICKKGSSISFFTKEMLFIDNLTGDEVKKLTLDQLDTTALEAMLGIDFLSNKIKNLSEGQTNKLLLLITLAPQADFYMIDELVNAIDYETKENIINYLNNIKASYILITHDQELKNKLQTNNTINIKIDNLQIIEI